MTSEVKKTRARGGASKSSADKPPRAPAEKATAGDPHESNIADAIRAAAIENPPHLLKPLDAQTRAKVLSECAIRRYAKGEPIIRAGEPAGNMYFIAGGRARVASPLCNGGEAAFARIGQGENFGELSLADDKHTTTVTALTDAQIIVMPPQTFQWLLNRQPSIALCLVNQLLESMHSLLKHILESSAQNNARRTPAELPRLLKDAHNRTTTRRTRRIKTQKNRPQREPRKRSGA